MIEFVRWIFAGIGLSGLGGVLDQILEQIETNTFIGNRDISLNAGIWLAIFAIGFLGWITLHLER